MKISDFAKRAGITVKTLLHYDKIGLLIPSSKSKAGYRIYSDEDFIKLQQIATLKFIGLSLNEIKEVLEQNQGNIGELLSMQKNYLKEKKKHIESVVQVIEKAEDELKEKSKLGVDNLIDIIKLANMENSVKEQYRTTENLNKRINLHSYNTNKEDWSNWCFNNIIFPKDAQILELGCGMGELWYRNKENISNDWSVVISDFSEPMLQKCKNKLEKLGHDFKYKVADVQNIPYEDNSFDVVIARHMLYLVPDIEKALREIKRVLKKGGKAYITTNGSKAMKELNLLMDKFDSSMGLGSNGMCYRFDNLNGKEILEKYFDSIDKKVFSGKIITDRPELIVEYKASSIRGREVLIGENKNRLKEFLEKHIEENGSIEITTEAYLFEVKKE